MRLICRLILISFACRCYLSSETPFITRDPRDAIRMEGGKVTFCCEAEGSPAYIFMVHDYHPWRGTTGTPSSPVRIGVA